MHERKNQPMFFTNSIANLLKRTVANCSECGVGGKSPFSGWSVRKRTVAFFFLAVVSGED